MPCIRHATPQGDCHQNNCSSAACQFAECTITPKLPQIQPPNYNTTLEGPFHWVNITHLYGAGFLTWKWQRNANKKITCLKNSEHFWIQNMLENAKNHRKMAKMRLFCDSWSKLALVWGKKMRFLPNANPQGI